MKIRSRFASLLLAGTVALGVVALPAVAADAATVSKVKTGTVSIQLINPARKALKKSGIRAVLFASNGDTKEAKSNSKGVITFKKVSKGSAGLLVYSAANVYFPAFKESLTVTAGKTKKLSIKLTAAATISGTVKDATGAVVKGLLVIAYDKYGDAASSAITSSKGTYKLTGLTSASYRVAFNPTDPTSTDDSEYTSTFWKNASTLDSATKIKVAKQTSKKSASAVKKVNGTVEKLVVGPSHIAGTTSIVGADSVSILDAGTHEQVVGIPLADGAYSIAVEPGDYIVALTVFEGSSLNTYYFSGEDTLTADIDNAATIPISALGVVKTVNFGQLPDPE